MHVVWVALGGSLGALTRYGLTTAAARLWPTLPAGTALANLIGCFVAGLLAPMFMDSPGPGRLLIYTGFLGGLTTLSGLSLEVVTLLEARRFGVAAATWGTGALVCVGLCAVGVWLGGRLAA